jgi:hypothetical protein
VVTCYLDVGFGKVMSFLHPDASMDARSILVVESEIERVPPSPPVFWNDEVRARLPPKSLRNKDLYAKYSGIRS